MRILRSSRLNTEMMSFCYECNQRAVESISGNLEAAKKKARAWGKKTGKDELIIVRNDNGTFGYRTADADLIGCTEVDRVLVML